MLCASLVSLYLSIMCVCLVSCLALHMAAGTGILSVTVRKKNMGSMTCVSSNVVWQQQAGCTCVASNNMPWWFWQANSGQTEKACVDHHLIRKKKKKNTLLALVLLFINISDMQIKQTNMPGCATRERHFYNIVSSGSHIAWRKLV